MIRVVHLVQVAFFAVEIRGLRRKADFWIFEGVV